MNLKLPSYPRPVMTRILNSPPPPHYVCGDERLLAKHRLVKKMKCETIQQKKMNFRWELKK